MLRGPCVRTWGPWENTAVKKQAPSLLCHHETLFVCLFLSPLKENNLQNTVSVEALSNSEQTDCGNDRTLVAF